MVAPAARIALVCSRMSFSRAAAAALCLAGFIAPGLAADACLSVESRIDLPGTAGRIDHLAYDAAGKRLFIAELGNNSVDVLDVATGRAVHRIDGLHEPQGIAYSPGLDRIYVANGDDGTVQSFKGADYSAAGRIRVGSDADNIRLDDPAKRLYVGYGDGAIAVLDAGTLQHVGEIGLKSHPESFQFSPADARLFVNVPGAREIAVASRTDLRQSESWSVGQSSANYPMAVDAKQGRVLVVFRRPAGISAYRLKDGKLLASAAVCADADDVFVDDRLQRTYVICGDGFVDVLDAGLARMARVKTTAGARTGLYSPQANRLFVAARAEGENLAQVWVLKPLP